MIFALRMFSDVALYFYFAGFIGSMLGSGTVFYLPILLLTLGAWLSFLLREKGTVLRCLPYLMAGFSAFWVSGLVDVCLLALPLGYLIYTSAKKLYSVERGDFIDRFQLFIKIMPVMLITLFWDRPALERFSLPYGVLYVVAAVYLMRLLRHDEAILRQNRFRLLNALGLAALFAAGLLLSSQAFLLGVKSVLGFIYTKVITPVLMLFAYLFVGLAWLLERLLRLIKFGQGRELEAEEMELGDSTGMMEMFGEVETSEVFGQILGALAMIAVAVLLVLLLRRMLGRRQPGPQTDHVAEYRAVITPKAQQKPRLRRGDPRDQVRLLYGRFLKLCAQYGIVFPPYYTSENIQNTAGRETWCDTAEADALRDVYLVARYSEAEISREDAQQARRRLTAIRARARETVTRSKKGKDLK